MLARAATQVSRIRVAAPWYSVDSGGTPADRAERPVGGADDVRDGDLVGRPREQMAAVRPAMALHQPGRRRSWRMLLRNRGGIDCASARRSALTGRPAGAAASSVIARIA